MSIDYLEVAAALAHDNRRAGGEQVGAVLITAAGYIVPGTHLVAHNLDPTAHAEIVAIRSACALLLTTDLSGSSLYVSSEPCPMCRAAADVAGIETLIYGPPLKPR